MLTIGFEGPVLAGKSTLIGRLARMLQQESMSVTAVPCYVDFAYSRNIYLPPPMSKQNQAQLAGLQQFFRIARSRSEETSCADILLLDRTPATLVAHSYGVRACGGADVTAEAESLFADAARTGLMPETIFFIKTDYITRLKRRNTRESVPEPFLLPDYNREFENFFENRLGSLAGISVRTINGNEATNSLVLDLRREIEMMI